MEPQYYREALSATHCGRIIQHVENNCEFIERNTNHHKFKEVMLHGTPELDQISLSLVDIFRGYLNDYIKHNKITTFPDKYGFEAVRLKRYDVGDCFPWHADVGDYASARRFLVGMFYLNDNFEGGKTEFGSEGKIKYTSVPETGKLALFTPFWDNPHRGSVILSGSKYIVNIYLHYL